MRLGTLLLLFSLAGCWGHEEYQLPDRPMRRDGTMLCVADLQTCNSSAEPIGTRQTRSCATEFEWKSNNHFPIRWKSNNHFQHVASGRTDAAAVDGITLLALTDWQRKVAIERNTSGIQLLLKSPAGEQICRPTLFRP